MTAIEGVSAVSRIVCGGCQDFKVVVTAPTKFLAAWEEKKFEPEEEFLEKLKAIEGITDVATQKYTAAKM